ncbi:hypothetical protein MRB53_036583 [Persea americana]|nr:hypothetical protein MRB53_042433 [Persea americana]KAJ8613968.1 hypothetical protein MRB53_036759 [Persea americana]KAJ8613995.1 hypothetical protein MRB53_036721 [Persea americana]KAJ8614385.1 hypothetical protein MRB53_036583 [Persea americana]
MEGWRGQDEPRGKEYLLQFPPFVGIPPVVPSSWLELIPRCQGSPLEVVPAIKGDSISPLKNRFTEHPRKRNSRTQLPLH